jgi:hypothetical protein
MMASTPSDAAWVSRSIAQEAFLALGKSKVQLSKRQPSLLKGMIAPPLVNETKMIDVNSTPFEEIDALPDFIKEKMKSSEEYRARVKHQENMAVPR